ncbi:MAG: DUF1175 domain-containing protein [Acidobacteria bacterium]|nr:DUF1175 domain-containing protein [Acidobacteriota bacterium]
MRTPSCSILGCLLLLACAALSGCGGTSEARARVETRAAATGKIETATRGAVVVGSIDADADGLPDAAELTTFGDRENFRRWFTGIAEQQFYEASKEWNEEQRDCAGLVRFSWREALRAHDRRWLARMGASYEAFAPDVRAYTLDHSPTGEKIFRTAFGAFRESDLKDETFSEFADARTLREFNSEFVSRERGAARAGDLVFFYQPHARKYPYHVMIFLGAARVEDEDAADWVVYHTGTSPHDKGTVKKVRLAVLDHHPDPRWRPVASNRNFLGFYRLKILQ